MTDAATPFGGFDVAAPPDDLEVGSVYIGTLTGFKPFSYTDGDEQRDLVEWQFSVDVDGEAVAVSGTTSLATGPKSKAFRWLTALMGAGAVQPGAHFDPTDLIGREGQLTIGENKNKWPKVDDVTALPRRR